MSKKKTSYTSLSYINLDTSVGKDEQLVEAEIDIKACFDKDNNKHLPSTASNS